jgi:hypothetical protein
MMFPSCYPISNLPLSCVGHMSNQNHYYKQDAMRTRGECGPWIGGMRGEPKVQCYALHFLSDKGINNGLRITKTPHFRFR